MKVLAQKEYPTAGRVQYLDSSRAKVLNITLKPFKPVGVSVPKGMSLGDAEAAFMNNLSWVEKEKVKMKAIEQKFTIFKPGDTYHIKDREIKILSTDDENRVERHDHSTTVYINELELPHPNNTIQAFIQDVIRNEMKLWCNEHLGWVTLQLAKQFNFPVQKTIIRHSTTRWGSMGKTNNLNLSLYVATLPDHLIEYVILHEFAHIKVRDHSKRYWDHLATFIPQPKELEKELKGYPIGII